jgi:phospholipid/cholesterol/gamma-HCH transport system substrate-binding protein
MVVFTMSCFGILLFLWLAFGGSIPLRPEGYRMKVAFPEAATLAVEADVRLAGVNVGKVKAKELDKGGNATVAELELNEKYAPVSKDSRAILRQKTLLGETYVELSPGSRGAGMLKDGDLLPRGQVEPTVELDEIFDAFDEPTREAFQGWVKELARSIRGGRSQDLNDAFGNFEGLAVDGARLLRELDQQKVAVRRLIKNTGVVFGAINERGGALRELIVNANNTFEATASRDRALAETFRVFPTFLDESRATLARLERFSTDTRPLVNALKRPADDLGPTVRDLGDLAPDLEGLFRDLRPLIRVSRSGLPDLENVLREAEPVFENAHLFLPELNPILALANFHQATVTTFISGAAADLTGPQGKEGADRYQTQVGVVGVRSFDRHITRPRRERGNAYQLPNGQVRHFNLGTYESFDCKPVGGQLRDPDDQVSNPNPATKNSRKVPPCFVQPPSMFSGKMFNRLPRGIAPLVRAPKGAEANAPANPAQR